MRLLTPPGVFSPISDTWMLAAALRSAPLPPHGRVLDLCTGSGALAIVAARRGATVTAVDASRRAVWTARLNARLNGVRARPLHGDLYAPVAGERFDLIVSNPPYVPSEGAALPRRRRARAWDAGADGRTLLDRVIAGAPAHLAPGGELLLVQSSICGERETLERLRAGGLQATVIERRPGPLGPRMRERAELLEARGLLAPGAREEQVLIVRGRAPQALIPPKCGMDAAAPLARPAA